MKHDITKDCKLWSGEMHKAASLVEENGDGSVECMEVIDGNRAVAETLAKAATEIERLRAELAEAKRAGGAT